MNNWALIGGVLLLVGIVFVVAEYFDRRDRKRDPYEADCEDDVSE